MWEDSALDHLIDILHSFQVGLFPKAISRSQEKSVELLGTLCRNVLDDRTWVEESINSINLQLVAIEAQGVAHFIEWREHVWAAVRKVNATEIYV